MILNPEAMKDAFERLSSIYNKIIFVDSNLDTYTIIKIETDEWDNLKTRSFAGWISLFMDDLLYPGDKEYFTKFMNDIIKGRLASPASTYYQKLVDGGWHDMLMDVMPGTPGQYYIFVKDMTKEV